MKKIIIGNTQYYSAKSSNSFEDDLLATWDTKNLKSDYYCLHCGTNRKHMNFIKEEGYYIRHLTYKCKCHKVLEITI